MAETYLIEVREGSGEPGFIELTPGVELAPLGVGTEGAWRIRGAGVLGVHLYLYFDGQALFAQSADQSKPVVVNGRTVGATWTPLTAPATIALGTARLFFRPNARDSDDDEDRTIAQAAPSELVSNDSSDDDRTIAQAPPMPPVRTAAPERPFVPGAFSSRSDESTRFAPIGDEGPDSQSTRVVPLVEGLSATETPELGAPAVRSMGPAAQRPPGSPVRPAAGVPWSATTGVGAPGSPLGSTAPLVQRTTAPDFARQPDDDDSSGQVTRAFAPLLPLPPNDAQQAGPYPAPPSPAGPPPGLLNVPPPQAAAPDGKPPGGRLAREWSAAPTTRKILYVSLLPALAGAFWVILSGNDPPPAQPRANQAGSASAAKSGSAPTGQTPPTPGPTPPGTPPATPPSNPPPTPPTPPPPPPPSGPTSPPPGGPNRPPPDPNLPVADAGVDADRRERSAADYVATGQYELAAQIYDTLARDNPKNPAFAEAARILRTKADAGIR
jgi:hypothetical protein